MTLDDMMAERSSLNTELHSIDCDLRVLTTGGNFVRGKERQVLEEKRNVLKNARSAVIERKEILNVEMRKAKAEAHAEYLENQKARKFETIKLIRELRDSYEEEAGEAKRFSVKRRMAAKFSDELTSILKAKG